MRSIVVRTLAILIVLPSLAQTVAAGDLPQQFISLYRPAVLRLQSAYSELTASGTVTTEYPDEGKSSQQSFVLRIDGLQRRLDLTTTAQQGMGLEVGATEMSMATNIGSLSTYRRPGSEFFDDARQRPYPGVIEGIARRSLIDLPYSFETSGTILDVLMRPNVKIESVKWIRSRGEPLVQVVYQENAKHVGRTGVWNSSLTLSPADGWALRSFDRTIGEVPRTVTQRGELQYSPGPDGIPLVQLISIETAENKRVIRRETVTFNELQFGAPGREWFDSFTF